jgi:hypothetical protein
MIKCVLVLHYWSAAVAATPAAAATTAAATYISIYKLPYIISV